MKNYSYHIIILVFLQTLYASTRGVTVRLGWRDNADPRSNIDDMEKSGKYSANLIKKLRRREAAHQNCYEALGIFCASVVSSLNPRLDPCRQVLLRQMCLCLLSVSIP
jgi:uncharacterized MAPEG superfamily protein